MTRDEVYGKIDEMDGVLTEMAQGLKLTTKVMSALLVMVLKGQAKYGHYLYDKDLRQFAIIVADEHLIPLARIKSSVLCACAYDYHHNTVKDKKDFDGLYFERCELQKLDNATDFDLVIKPYGRRVACKHLLWLAIFVTYDSQYDDIDDEAEDELFAIALFELFAIDSKLVSLYEFMLYEQLCDLG